jgi:hypothetical protein
MARLVHERGERDYIAAKSSSLQPNGVDLERAKPQPAVTTALERLTSFIPTEVVAAWAAEMGMLAPQSALGSWAVYSGAIALSNRAGATRNKYPGQEIERSD